VTQYTQDYVGGIEYRNGILEAIYHAEGRITTINSALKYEYALKDHLGNTRIMFCDKDGNGVISSSSTPESSEITQENHYYPFGLNMEGNWVNTPSVSDSKYQYNGKELNDDFGLGLMDYGARFYDAAIGQWTTFDPLAEKMRRYSPYNYVLDNPMRFIDPDGMAPTDVYVDKEGKYLGKDDAKTNEVRVIDEKTWEGVQQYQDGNTEALQGASMKLSEYGEGIKITEETKGKIESEGGNMPEPYVSNNSDATIYYKPEGPEHNGPNGAASGPNPNPGKEATEAYPIAPHTDLYAPVDGVKPMSHGDNVYKVPTGGRITVDKNDGVSMNASAVVSSMAGTAAKILTGGKYGGNYGTTSAPDASWHALRDSKPHK
jgi:RHS repeat-associated protein